VLGRRAGAILAGVGASGCSWEVVLITRTWDAPRGWKVWGCPAGVGHRPPVGSQ
jgi:hypothetical protein